MNIETGEIRDNVSLESMTPEERSKWIPITDGEKEKLKRYESDQRYRKLRKMRRKMADKSRRINRNK